MSKREHYYIFLLLPASSQEHHYPSPCFIRFDEAERSSLLVIKLRRSVTLHTVASQNLAVFYLCGFPEPTTSGCLVSASDYVTDAFNKGTQPPSGKPPCFIRTFKSYQSCFISVY